MIIGSTKENLSIEKRIAITPDIAKKYVNLSFEVFLPENYGLHLGFNDSEYKELGVKISKDEKENLFYNPAFQSYADSSYSDAISKFQVYLSKFPDGRFVNETYYFLGNSFYKIKDTLSALNYFEKFLETPTNVYSESRSFIFDLMSEISC